MRITRLPLVLALTVGACVHDGDDFPLRIEQALDAAAVDLDGAMTTAEQAMPDGTVVAAELVLDSVAVPVSPGGVLLTEDATFLVDVWRDERLSRAFIGLGGEIEDIRSYGNDERAADAAELIRDASWTLFEAIESAENIIDDGRAFSAIVDGTRYEVEVVARGRVYEVDISPVDGSILEIDVEDEWGHHDCPHWGC